MFASDICLIPYLTNRLGSRPGKTTPSVETVAHFKRKRFWRFKGALANKELGIPKYQD